MSSAPMKPAHVRQLPLHLASLSNQFRSDRNCNFFGGFRTNVKYVEVGRFPSVKRDFLVQRCNQCTDAPCVAICPVGALWKLPNGIVDVDREACIGCRACMQACPYDALYLNEDLGAVEKCHFCAHRIEKGLEPACVTVCPVGAIIPGDFDDPDSRVGREQPGNVGHPRPPVREGML